MGRKEKIGPAGRYGARYGRGIKNRVNKVEREQRKKHICPKCESDAVRRLSKGIFLCGKCNNKFAGGAYMPTTLSGKIIGKMVTQKSFMPNMAELIEVHEEISHPSKAGGKEETYAEPKAGAKAKAESKAGKPAKKAPEKKDTGEKKEEKTPNAKKKAEKEEKKQSSKGLIARGLSALKGKKKEK